jgi:hypothetical protein
MTKMSRRLIRAALLLLLNGLILNTCHAQLVIDSLDGEVTQNEVDTFISNVSALSIPTAEWTATVTHNQLADGKGGMTLEGINYMAEITADIPSLSTEHTQLLNLAIKWNDAWLTHRNDLPLGEGRVMWTGNVEPVWPPNCPTCSSPTYYESEVGDTIGHMAHTALNILKTPAIWNNTVPDGDPNNFGATYLARAKTYVSMLEFSMSNAFTPHFIDPNTLLITRPSTADGYQSSFHNVNAWNVMMMLSNAYWELAQCHVILGDNPSLVTEYKTIVRKTADMFVQNAQPLTAPDGTAGFDWGYCNFGDCTGHLTGEQMGVHGSYDIWGLTRAYASGYTTVPTAAQMKIYADTIVHETTLSTDSAGAATYASFNDRCCSTSTYSYLPYGLIFLTPYNTGLYKPAANADINTGRLAGDPGTAAGVLWAKHWIFVHSQPPDFTLTAGPASQTVTATGSTSYTASASPLNGFSGTVNLTVNGLPNGATASFSSSSISGGSGSSTLNVSTSCSTPAGTYTLTITGTSGSLSHNAAVTLTVNAAASDFTISASPSSNTVIVGSATSYTTSVSATTCFAGTVGLSVSGLPAGASATFNPASITGSGSSTLSITTSSSTPAGTYTVTIAGASGTLSHSTTVTMIVPPPDFSITAAPNSKTVTQGGSTSYTANVSAANGFAGTVSLSVSGLPSGASATFNPGSISGSGSSTLSISTTSTASTGSFTLTITGVSGSLTHSSTVSLTINPSTNLPSGWGDTDIGSPASPGSASFTSGVFTVNGEGADIYGASDQFNYASQSLAGDMIITARVASQQNTNAWAKSGVMIRETTAANSSFVHVFITPGHGVNMQYRNGTGTGAVQLAQVAGPVAPYWVRLVRSGNTFTGFASADGTTWTQVGTISVTMAGSVQAGLAVTSHNTAALNTSTFDNVTVSTPMPDFSISASPSSQTITTGGSTSYTASVTPLNGFTGTVNLSADGSPAGVTCSFNPTAITASGSSTLTCAASSTAATGTFTLTITGTNGSLAHSATVSLTINSACALASADGAWHDTPIGVTETGTFTASFDATPSVAPISAGVGISQGAQTAYSGFANIVVFTTGNQIQAYNGTGYQGTVAYSVAAQPYHFRVIVNIPLHTYSIFVTPPGGTEQTVGSNFLFRSTQNTVTSLDTWGALVNASPSGTLNVCNFAVQ